MEHAFGYPKNCSKCTNCELRVKPFFQSGNDFRLMLVGQDPTIRKKGERVKTVLMLDDPKSQLYIWLRGMFGSDGFINSTIYATNLVKCTLRKTPSDSLEGGSKFLQTFFNHCKDYLITEVEKYKPDMVVTFGETTHKYFRTLLNSNISVPKSMKDAFSGQFYTVSVGNTSFIYSPCLHIQTYRVADTYGERLNKFKAGLAKSMSK